MAGQAQPSLQKPLTQMSFGASVAWTGRTAAFLLAAS